MDILTLGGILVAIIAILGGQALEGGHAGSLMQLTAAIIVFGGTLGAVMVNFPMEDFMRGVKLLKLAFGNKKVDLEAIVKELLEYATVARREGLLSLEGKLTTMKDPYMKRGLQLLVDGVDASVTRDVLEMEAEHETEENNIGAKVWEAAGGYAPTIGILGAVLGLIHVMENLDDPSKLGPGIAVAFVATVYGVGGANILFLPFAAKIKRKVALEQQRKMLILEGVLGIQEGLNPRVLEERLRPFLPHKHQPAKPAAAAG